MSARKSERLLNLLILLLMQRSFISKEQIRELLYPGSSAEAFDRMFDRDKEELRSIGVPIEVGSIDAYFDDEPGYRIRPDRMALPEVSLEADEAAVVGLATRVWQYAPLAKATVDAVAKLEEGGNQIDTDALDLVEPRLTADEPAFDVLLEAVRDRRPVRFAYRRGASNQVGDRRVQPWGLVRSSGRWYAVGFDLERRAERVFRLSRIVGDVEADGPAGAFSPPDDVDLRGIVAAFAPEPTREQAVVLLRPGAAASLRRQSTSEIEAVTGPDGTRWDRVTLPDSGPGTADELLALGADAYVEGPPALRASVRDRLARAVAVQ